MFTGISSLKKERKIAV